MSGSVSGHRPKGPKGRPLLSPDFQDGYVRPMFELILFSGAADPKKRMHEGNAGATVPPMTPVAANSYAGGVRTLSTTHGYYCALAVAAISVFCGREGSPSNGEGHLRLAAPSAPPSRTPHLEDQETNFFEEV